MRSITATTEVYAKLRPGDKIEVSFGSHGTQRAEVVRRTKEGNVYVTKFRAKSGSWTKPVRIWPSEVLKLFI